MLFPERDANPLQHFTNAVQGTLRDLQNNGQQLQRNLNRLAFASISGGVQALPVRKDALVSAATIAARVGAFFGQQPQQPELSPGDGRVVCLEFTKGKRRVYRRKQGGAGGSEGEGFEVTDDHVMHRQRVRDMFSDYLLPQGYPDSVAPQYASYMMWRGVQYFFGGAMSVFTTRSLLQALGMSRNSGEAAAAINWVLKDGAGRLGRFLFARWGRQLDCELKQFRLAGDLLMEAGAALELATVAHPPAFLALACTANLAKNLAAVAASATRAPIYRTFARQNNMADITAKGESVANLSDILGTAFGIALAKMNLPVVPTFCLLSVGYLVSSRREVDSVVLPYLNRARLSYVSRAFLGSGLVPEPLEANANEPLLPWADPTGARIVLGASVEEACPAGPAALADALATFPGRQYALTYRPDTKKAYVLLMEGADCQQLLRATFDAQVLLFMINRAAAGAGPGARPASKPARQAQQQQRQPQQQQQGEQGKQRGLSQFLAAAAGNIDSARRSGGATRLLTRLDRATDTLAAAAAGGGGTLHTEAARHVAQVGPELYRQFERQAEQQGWRLPLTMLNASETRLRPVQL